jgi:RecA-family ATPase
MNAPTAPHIAYGDREAVLTEISRLMWAISTHAENGERYATLDCRDGLELALKSIRACLVQALEMRKGSTMADEIGLDIPDVDIDHPGAGWWREEPKANGADRGAHSFSFLDVAGWEGQPVPLLREAVPGVIPAANVCIASGHGGAGKTLLLMQLCAATVLGRGWLNYMPEPGPAMMVCCEDDEGELHRRLARIAAHYGASFRELRELYLICLAGQDAVLGAPDRTGIIKPTPLFSRIRNAAIAIRPRTIVLDNAADIYAGNENERGMVRQFITMLRGLAIESGAAVILTLHPSLTGINSGTGISGNTAWFNSVRAQLYLKPAETADGGHVDKDLRELEARKNNYGPLAETTMLRWRDGVFVVEGKAGGLDKLAAEKKAEDTFLMLLGRFTRQGQHVSAKKGPTYAPALFAEHPEASGITKQALAKAMQRLLDGEKISVEEYGPASHRRSRLVLV